MLIMHLVIYPSDMNSHEINKCVKCNKNYLVIYKNDEVVNSIVRCDECELKVFDDIKKAIDFAWDKIKDIDG